MKQLKFFKVLTLPDSPITDSIYIVPTEDNIAEWWVTSETGDYYKLGNSEILNEIADFAGTIDQQYGEINLTKEQIDSIKTNIDTQQDDINQKSQQVAQNKQSIDATKEQIDSIKTNVDTQQVDVNQKAQQVAQDRIVVAEDKATTLGYRNETVTAAEQVSTTLLSVVLGWVYAQSFRVVSASRDINGAITTASIIWPDGKTGAFTTLVASIAFPGAIDSYRVTYVNGSTTTTYTQSSVTRDASGAVIAQPSIVIS